MPIKSLLSFPLVLTLWFLYSMGTIITICIQYFSWKFPRVKRQRPLPRLKRPWYRRRKLKHRPLVRNLFVVLFCWCLFTSGFSIQLLLISTYVRTRAPLRPVTRMHASPRGVCVISGRAPFAPHFTPHFDLIDSICEIPRSISHLRTSPYSLSFRTRI
jgi:hypothetical protein